MFFLRHTAQQHQTKIPTNIDYLVKYISRPTGVNRAQTIICDH